jgi:Trp operon repressor
MQSVLYKAVKACENEREFLSLMRTTFTDKELEMLDERWHIFNSIAQGLPQRTVASDNNCSIATVTRGAKAYRDHKKTVDKYLKVMFND